MSQDQNAVSKKPGRLGRVRWFGFAAALAAALGLISLFLAVEISSQPRFCGSCHVMEPYYQSWVDSSHQDVACVDCHIPPGVAQEVRKKYEALSMVVSYFTGTYGTNPWAEIDDAACLRCHERRLLAGKELFGDILFNHTPHLTELRRGKRLRCTSCHSQIVQGRHITVTPSTCILCHFKAGAASSEDISDCKLCHSVPEKIVEKGLLRFDHSDVKRFDMDCRSCHSGTAFGSTGGGVPKERCFTCHNDRERLDQFGETDLLHRRHVSEHKVDCLHCHLEIQHGGPGLLHGGPETSCQTCHRGGHSPQRDLYLGIGGRGVPPMPAPMHLAGVSCEGCHMEVPGHETETSGANEIACMSCHGPRYRSVLNRWKESVGRRTKALRSQLQQTVRLFPASEPESLQDARSNLELVERGRGVHNVRYAFALLSKSQEFINQARRGIGRSALAAPWPKIPYETPCAECHEGIESQRGSAFGRSFDHRVHVAGQELQCERCHRPHEEKPAGEVLRFSGQGCNDCHHQQSPGECITCHGGILEREVTSFRGDFSHELHVGMDLSCPACHSIQKEKPVALQREICSDCHED